MNCKINIIYKILEMKKKHENFIAMYPQNKKDALPAKIAARTLDKKYFKQQMNYIVLIQIGNHLIQFVMSFLVRPVGFLLLRYSVLFTVESLSLLYQLVIS